MTINKAKEKFIEASDNAISYPDSTEVVSLHSIFIILDKIYNDFDEQLKEMYIKGGDDCFKALKESGKLREE